jgi:hypothetical protein
MLSGLAQPALLSVGDIAPGPGVPADDHLPILDQVRKTDTMSSLQQAAWAVIDASIFASGIGPEHRVGLAAHIDFSG